MNDPTQVAQARGRTRTGQLVASRTSRLQAQYLAGHPSAAADLARLRRGVGKPVGSMPELWALTLEGLPDAAAATSEAPTPAETAVHTALTLYAVHQQSVGEPMHRPGNSLGRAARLLGKASASEEAVQRRFRAVGTADSFAEVVYHARGLVTQLNASRIPLDYGLLADHILQLQNRRGAERVRLAWGRDYYGVTDTAPDAAHGPQAARTETTGDAR